MRALLPLVLALALAPVAAAQGFETDLPCEVGAPQCAEPPARVDDGGAVGEVGTGQEVPATEDAAGGGQGPGVQAREGYDVGSYLPWVILSVVTVAALVAALGYTMRTDVRRQ